MDRRAEAQQPRYAALMSTKLNKRQRIAAELIGLGYRPSAVAGELNVSRETVSRWRQLPNFNEQSQKAHLDLLASLLADRLQLLDRCHEAIADALKCKDTNKAIKASVAVRYLALNGSQSHVYYSLENDHGRLSARDEESNRAFQWMIEKLDGLAKLKTTNGHLTDAEYRKKAEDIVRE